MSAALRLREDYDAQHMRALAKASRDAKQTRRLLALAAIHEGASRAEAAAIGGVARQPFDKLRSAQVGGGLQRAWARGASRRHGAGQPTAAQPRAARSAQADHRGRPQSGGGRGGALASHRSGAVGLCRVPHFDQQTDAQPDAARDGLSQALCSSAPSRPGPRRAGGFKKVSRAPGGDPEARCGRPADRGVVSLRRDEGAHRTEEQDHPAPSTGSGGPNAAPGRRRRAISAPPRPIYSARSVPERATAQPSSCRAATPQR